MEKGRLSAQTSTPTFGIAVREGVLRADHPAHISAQHFQQPGLELLGADQDVPGLQPQ